VAPAVQSDVRAGYHLSAWGLDPASEPVLDVRAQLFVDRKGFAGFGSRACRSAFHWAVEAW